MKAVPDWGGFFFALRTPLSIILLYFTLCDGLFATATACKCSYQEIRLPVYITLFNMIKKLLTILLISVTYLSQAQNKIVVFQSDFGVKDGAVSAMKGVATGVSADLKLYDLTHEIPAYNIWEASYRLYQTVNYWPAGTVFVSVVDPGVGTARKSVVLKTKTGQYIVCLLYTSPSPRD